MRSRPWRLAALSVLMIAVSCEDTPTGAAGPRTVTLVTHDSFDVSKEVLESFEAETGIDVRILRAGDAGQMVNRAILTAGNPEGDVLFGIDNNLLSSALDAGVFDAYSPTRLSAVPDAYEVDDRVTPIDRGDVCVNYDSKWFASEGLNVPESLEELAEPAFRGLLVVENPATSTPGLAFLLATIARFGEGWEGYWTTLVENDVLVVNGWERAYFGEFSGAGGGSGTRPLVVSYASSPPAEVVFSEEPVKEAPTGVVQATCYQQIEYAGVLDGAEHPDEARALIDFMLSVGFQEDIPLRMFVFPLVEDAELPAVFVKYAITPKDPLALLPADVEANRTDWVQRWTDLVLR